MVLPFSGTVRAQESMINVPEYGLTLKQWMTAVESQTDYQFAYDSSQVDVSFGAGLSPGSHALRDLLDKMQTDGHFSYRIDGRYIILGPPLPAAVAPEALPEDQNYRPTDPSSVEAASIRRPIPSRPESVPIPPEPAGMRLIPALPEGYSAYFPADRYAVPPKGLPASAIKTNLFYGAAALTPNLSVEIGLSPKTSFELYGSYNPWNRIGKPGDNDKLVHWVVRPEYRYWFCERFNGHFIGAHALFSKYNISGKEIPLLRFKKEFRYEGTAYGAGLTYGFHWALSGRWGLEFSAGVGLLRTNYEKYDCTLCSGVIEKTEKTYLGPTRASVSLVFMIK